jgi:hypothetical protein
VPPRCSHLGSDPSVSRPGGSRPGSSTAHQCAAPHARSTRGGPRAKAARRCASPEVTPAVWSAHPAAGPPGHHHGPGVRSAVPGQRSPSGGTAGTPWREHERRAAETFPPVVRRPPGCPGLARSPRQRPDGRRALRRSASTAPSAVRPGHRLLWVARPPTGPDARPSRRASAIPMTSVIHSPCGPDQEAVPGPARWCTQRAGRPPT